MAVGWVIAIVLGVLVAAVIIGVIVWFVTRREDTGVRDDLLEPPDQ
jgi:hypothetical protein